MTRHFLRSSHATTASVLFSFFLLWVFQKTQIDVIRSFHEIKILRYFFVSSCVCVCVRVSVSLHSFLIRNRHFIPHLPDHRVEFIYIFPNIHHVAQTRQIINGRSFRWTKQNKAKWNETKRNIMRAKFYELRNSSLSYMRYAVVIFYHAW